MTFGLPIIPVLSFNLILHFSIINYFWLKSRTETKVRQFIYALYIYVDIAGGKEAEGVWEHGVEENIWTEKGRGNGGMEEIV